MLPATGCWGLSALGLRGLSPLRTLVLLDGQRIVSSHFSGVVDISQMPQLLLQRVDVVTGGASASWGSDAVAGVVNFITDKRFEGFKLNVMSGLSTAMATWAPQISRQRPVRLLPEDAVTMRRRYSYNDGLLPRLPVQGSFGPQPREISAAGLCRGWLGAADYGVGKAPAGQPRFVYAPLIQGTGAADFWPHPVLFPGLYQF